MTETLTPRVRKGGLKSQKGQAPELKVPFLFNGVTCSWRLFLCPWSFGGIFLGPLPCLALSEKQLNLSKPVIPAPHGFRMTSAHSPVQAKYSLKQLSATGRISKKVPAKLVGVRSPRGSAAFLLGAEGMCVCLWVWMCICPLIPYSFYECYWVILSTNGEPQDFKVCKTTSLYIIASTACEGSIAPLVTGWYPDLLQHPGLFCEVLIGWAHSSLCPGKALFIFYSGVFLDPQRKRHMDEVRWIGLLVKCYLSSVLN